MGWARPEKEEQRGGGSHLRNRGPRFLDLWHELVKKCDMIGVKIGVNSAGKRSLEFVCGRFYDMSFCLSAGR